MHFAYDRCEILPPPRNAEAVRLALSELLEFAMQINRFAEKSIVPCRGYEGGQNIDMPIWHSTVEWRYIFSMRIAVVARTPERPAVFGRSSIHLPEEKLQ